MRVVKFFTRYITLALLVVNCSSAQKLQEQSPIDFGDVYYRKWISGVKGGGSGLNLVITVSEPMPQNIHLDSVYFRGKASKLERIKDDNILFIGRFKSLFNQKQDIIMSSDPTKEYGNELPEVLSSNTFELKDDECVVSYTMKGNTKYYKIKNLREKPAEHYPTAPPNKQ